MEYSDSPSCDDGQHGEVGPFEKWDLVAWPKRSHFQNEDMVEFLERIDQPHLNGKPMNVGYVRKMYQNYVMVEEASVGIMGSTIRDNPVSLDHPQDEMLLKSVRCDRIVAKKEREHNDLYQQKKDARERSAALEQARREWRKQPLWYRLIMTLAVHKHQWIEGRSEEIYNE